MQIQVEANPNCEGTEQFVYNELEAPRAIRGLKLSDGDHDVTGVEAGGRFTPAKSVKITDSGAGFAFLIYGGGWGIRLRPASRSKEEWSLENRHQWGEPFKIYGEPEDIIYAQ